MIEVRIRNGTSEKISLDSRVLFFPSLSLRVRNARDEVLYNMPPPVPRDLSADDVVWIEPGGSYVFTTHLAVDPDYLVPGRYSVVFSYKNVGGNISGQDVDLTPLNISSPVLVIVGK